MTLLFCGCTKDPSRPLVELTYDEGEEIFRTEYTYNQRGDILSCASDFSEVFYSYDDNGNLLTQTSENRGTVYTYDENDNILCIDEYCDGELESSYTYTYSDGLLVSSSYFYDGCRGVSTYDKYGNIQQTTESMESGDEIFIYFDNTYEDGKLVEVKVYEDDVLSTHHKYDKWGHETLYVTYNGHNGDENYREEKDYDDNGKMTRSCIRYTDEEMSYENTRIYTYRLDGLLTCVRDFDYEDVVSEYAPVYETLEVSPEQAAKLAKAAEGLYVVLDNY